jgi:hypothetical protein
MFQSIGVNKMKISESQLHQLRQDQFCAEALLGEVSGATYISVEMLMEDNEFMHKVTGYIVRADKPFRDAVSSLSEYINNKY